MKLFAIATTVLAIAFVTGWALVAEPHDGRLTVPSAGPTLADPDQAPGIQRVDRADQGQVSHRVDRADGYIADGDSISPFTDDHPAIANLRPSLRTALRDGATAARHDGIEIGVTAGWRSARYQQALLDEAIETYGSEDEARRWVSTPDLSAHVSGDAVDIGPPQAAEWLRLYGFRFGLCQIYSNEPWHFELATTAGVDCPPSLPDASG